MSAAAPPRWVHVSSSGVTRPSRPGIDIEKEPPAVRMNEMLGGILDYKLKGVLGVGGGLGAGRGESVMEMTEVEAGGNEGRRRAEGSAQQGVPPKGHSS